MTEKAYTVDITLIRRVEVIASSWKEAQLIVEEMWEMGDAAATGGDITFPVKQIKELDEDGNPIDN